MNKLWIYKRRQTHLVRYSHGGFNAIFPPWVDTVGEQAKIYAIALLDQAANALNPPVLNNVIQFPNMKKQQAIPSEILIETPPEPELKKPAIPKVVGSKSPSKAKKQLPNKIAVEGAKRKPSGLKKPSTIKKQELV